MLCLFATKKAQTMDTNNKHKKDLNDDGCPQRVASEDSTAEAVVAPRVVITGINSTPPKSINLTDCPTVGERITSISGYKNTAKLVLHPIPNDAAPKDAAIIDWFSCTLRLSPNYAMNELIADLRTVFNIDTLTMSVKGWCGYHKRADLGGYGLLAWEGIAQRDTAHLSLNAHGCAHVTDWHLVKNWGEVCNARIGRVDLAHDDFSGAVWNANTLRTEYLQDGFVGSDGRKPKSSLVGDWDNADKGRTYYIGSRAAGKMLRGYEKGKQLGELDNPWFRLELELRGANRVIPWVILTQPGQYLAGAYPCLSKLSTTPCKLETSIKAASMEYEKTLAHLKKQWGQFISLVLAVEKYDPLQAIQKLSRQGFPERFIPQFDYLLRNRQSDDLP